MDDRNTTTGIELGGRLWELRMGHKVLQQFSVVSKVPMSRLGEALDRYDLITLLLWCMLWVQDKTVTRAQLDDWLDEANIMEVFQRVAEAAQAAFPAPEDTEEEDPQQAAGTGSRA